MSWDPFFFMKTWLTWTKELQFSAGESQFRRYLEVVYPRKINISPEQCWLEDYFPFEMAPFQVTFVNFLGGWDPISMVVSGSGKSW